MSGDSKSRKSNREIVYRCREPFVIGSRGMEFRAAEPVEISRDGHEVKPESKAVVVTGIASSTSVDSHGTEMSLHALSRMAEQMNAGLPLLPRHNNGSRAVEWDEVIGRTQSAEVERADVVSPGAPAEVGYTLKLTSLLYMDDPMSDRLLRRLDRGEPIGQSIGGWFLSVRVVEGDSGEIERVIVEDVELDHVALTRAPSNPDSIGLANLRSRFAEIRDLTEQVEDSNMKSDRKMDERHIIEVVEDSDEGTVTVKFGMSDKYEGIVKISGDEDRDAHEDEEKSYHDEDEEKSYHDDEERAGHKDDEDDRGAKDDDDRDGHEDEEDREAHEEDERMSAEDEEREGHEDDEDRATPESIEVGVFISCVDSDVEDGKEGGYRYGQVTEVITEGSVEGASADASEADPVIKVAEYVPSGDGYEPNGEEFVKLVSEVEKIPPLAAPKQEAEVDGGEEPTEAVAMKEPHDDDRTVAPSTNISEGEPPPVQTHDASDDRSSVDGLDVTAELIHDTGEGVTSPATRSVPPATTSTSTTESHMTPSDLEAIRQLIRDEVSRATGTDAPSEPNAQPTEEAVEANPDVAALEAELTALRSAVTKLSKQPVRRGLAYQVSRTTAGYNPTNTMSAIVERARGEAPSSAQVVERTAEMIDDAKSTPKDLSAALAAVLRAAEAEGLLGNPHPARWS